MLTNKAYCERCNKKVKYVIDTVGYEVSMNNKIIRFIGKEAVCEVCKHEVFVEKIEKYNQIMFETEALGID